jgi:PAS domain S-box-containing protein
MSEIFGYPADEMLGRAPCDFAFEEDAPSYPQQLAQYMQSGRALFDVRFRRKDGIELWVSINFAPIIGDQGQPLGFLGMVTDITKRRQAEQALAQSEAALKHTNEELRAANDKLRISNETLELRVAERTADLEYRTGQLRALAEQLTRAEENERMRVAEVLHDGLQQMLVGARLNLEALGEQFHDDSVRQGLQEVSGILDESIQVSHSLVYELSPPILHRKDLAAILRWLGQWFQAKHRLIVQVDKGPGVEVSAKEIRAMLFRCVSELLFNIVKHTQVKSVRLSLSRTEDDSIQIAVSHEGAGLDQAAIQDQADRPVGFGLFHLRRRLELFGGRLEVLSTLGPGRCFKLLLPLSPSR